MECIGAVNTQNMNSYMHSNTNKHNMATRMFQILTMMQTLALELGTVTKSASEKTTPWASKDNLGYPCIEHVDWDNQG